jgi:hypothetical protein
VNWVIAGVVLALTVTGCSGPSVADCERAMWAKWEAMKAGEDVGTEHPAECAGVPDDQVRKIMFDIIQDAGGVGG